MSDYNCPKNCSYRTPTCHCVCATYARRQERQRQIRKGRDRENILAEYSLANSAKRKESRRKI